jgi:hypothetical protein
MGKALEEGKRVGGMEKGGIRGRVVGCEMSKEEKLVGGGEMCWRRGNEWEEGKRVGGREKGGMRGNELAEGK